MLLCMDYMKPTYLGLQRHFPWSAPPFCIYKGNFKKYKGKFSLIFNLQNGIYICALKRPAHRKVACTCNFLCMQLPQDGCRSTRLNFRNAVLWDGHSQTNKYIHFWKIKIWRNFPLYFLKFSLYKQNSGALQGKCIYNHNYFFVGFMIDIRQLKFSLQFREDQTKLS